MAHYIAGNLLLDAFLSTEGAEASDLIELVDLTAGQIVHEPGEALDFVVFPIDSVLSVVQTLRNGNKCEVGMIGNEGASGVRIVFGSAPLRTTICQVPGQAARVRTSTFIAAATRNSHFNKLILAAEIARTFFVEQMLICSTEHAVGQRLVRWLLQLADRTNRDEYSLTHDAIATMLGVRRATVTLEAQLLQKAGTIAYKRGIVRILDRQQLESMCCECYGEMRNASRFALHVGDAAAGTPSETRNRLEA